MNVIAVDVGTTSVRLALTTFQGDNFREAKVLASSTKDIGHKQDGVKFEQNSSEIWRAICHCCRECLGKSAVEVSSIKGIAFSATCSLVVEADDNPHDVIMWMDHRAIKEAQDITDSHSKVLHQFGGVCSPEFSLSKMVWLKEHDRKTFDSATGFFELPDWLVAKCLGSNSDSSPRSLCCVTCKWGYDVETMCHCEQIRSLSPDILSKAGRTVLGPGTVAGPLCYKAAAELGLAPEVSTVDKENHKPPDVVVGTSLIDAHSGMLAMLSISLERFGIEQKIPTTFCSLAGTSTCHMVLSDIENFKQGIWGPYKDVILQGYHLLEAGQSLTGKLIEINIESHHEGKKRLKTGEKMYQIIQSLNDEASRTKFNRGLHILPTYHGNRSPLANPRLKGGIYGLTAEGEPSLLEQYVATVESIAYETKFIVETLGTKLETMLVSGGLVKNRLFMQTLADVLDCRVVRASLKDVDSMVLGSALVARHAVMSQSNRSVPKLAGPLTSSSTENIIYDQLDIETYKPRLDQLSYHSKKYLCYREFVSLSQRVDKILNLTE